MERLEKSFSLSPMKQEIDLKAGEVYEGSVLVSNPNTSIEDFEYEVHAMPYSVSLSRAFNFGR